MRSFFATICPTKDFRAFLENHLSQLFSYQGSYNKPEQREGQHDFSMSDVHSGGSQRWQLQWIRRKHSPRHRGKSTEFVWELLSLLSPHFLRGPSCPSHEWRLPMWQVDFKCCVALQNKPSVNTGGSNDPQFAAAGLNGRLKWTRCMCVLHSLRKLQDKQGYTPRRVAWYSTGLHQACVLRLLA